MAQYDRVILVDDDEISNYINENLIEEAKLGNFIKIYVAAEKALSDIEMANNVGYTLLLLDLKMPVFDGFDFLVEFNKLPDYFRSKYDIVVLSSSENPKDIDRLKKLGIDKYIIKPLTKEKILDCTSEN